MSAFGQWDEIFKFYRDQLGHPVSPRDEEGHRRNSHGKDNPNNIKTIVHNPNPKYSGLFCEHFSSESKPKRELTFKEMLLEMTFNLTDLHISDNQILSIDHKDDLFLPAVKILSWHDEPALSGFQENENSYQAMDTKKKHAIYRILCACTNLKLIRNFHFDSDVEVVLATGKIYAIRELCLFDHLNIDHLLDFIGARPLPSILQLVDTGSCFNYLSFDDRKKLALAVRLLLCGIFESLRVLDLTQFCSHIDIQIPRPLINLHDLTLGSIYDYPYIPSRVLPRHIDLNETFPNLHVLDVSRLQCDENCYWNLYFPVETFRGNFETVKVLVVSDSVTHFFMEKLRHELCPNVSKLVVHSGGLDNSLDFWMVKLFHFHYWENLKGLEIQIHNFHGNLLSLDSTLTGLTEETCKGLWVFGPDHQHDKTISDMQTVAPSIGHLTNLKSLEIILGHNCLEKLTLLPPDSKPLISFVSERYGFHHLPNLDVSIIYDQECPWGQELTKRFHSIISPEVILKHRHDVCCCQSIQA